MTGDRHVGPNREEYWYDFPERFSGAPTTSANPWLACLLPTASLLGEPLVLCAPVDPCLLENAYERMSIWHAWDPAYSVVPIEADLAAAPAPRVAEPRTASFFTGGVDSFFTALRPRPTPIHELLLVQGTRDLPIERDEVFARVREFLAPAAAALERELVTVASNVFSCKIRSRAPNHMRSAAQLISVALVLEARLGRVLVPASCDLDWLDAWGSHPLTDPLLSTTETSVVADGVAFRRVEKTEHIADSPIALRFLRVCMRPGHERNCAQCEKCLRTMMTLAACGALERSAAFGSESLDLERCARIPLRSETNRYFIREIEAFARRQGRQEVADAAARACRRSERLERLRVVKDWLRARPLLGPAVGRLAAAWRGSQPRAWP